MLLKDFNELPWSVREDVRKTLRAFSECYIRFHNGEYHVSTSIMLCANYPADYMVVGDVKASDVFTADERIINYIETFYDFPLGYKGERDYDMLDYMRAQGGTARVKLVDGTARLII